MLIYKRNIKLSAEKEGLFAALMIPKGGPCRQITTLFVSPINSFTLRSHSLSRLNFGILSAIFTNIVKYTILEDFYRLIFNLFIYHISNIS